MLAIILGKVRKILQDFSRSWKEIQENFWTFWQENQDYPNLATRTMKSLHQSNTRSVDILKAINLETQKKELLLRVLLSEPQLGLTKKMKQK